MGKYVIFKIPSELSYTKMSEMKRQMQNIAIKEKDAYFVSLGDYQNYLIYKNNDNNRIVLPFKAYKLTEKEFINYISGDVLTIKYKQENDTIIISDLKIHPLLNSYTFSSPTAHYTLLNNDGKSSIKMIERGLAIMLPVPYFPEYIIGVGSSICGVEAMRLKEYIDKHQDKIYNYIITNLIEKHSYLGKYEVKI